MLFEISKPIEKSKPRSSEGLWQIQGLFKTTTKIQGLSNLTVQTMLQGDTSWYMWVHIKYYKFTGLTPWWDKCFLVQQGIFLQGNRCFLSEKLVQLARIPK